MIIKRFQTLYSIQYNEWKVENNDNFHNNNNDDNTSNWPAASVIKVNK